MSTIKYVSLPVYVGDRRMCQTNSSCSSQGCCRHSAADALITGLYSSIGSRKSENFLASTGSQSYFSTSTLSRLHGFSLVIFRRLPAVEKGIQIGVQLQLQIQHLPQLVKYFRPCLPRNITDCGIDPSSSTMCAR